MKRLREQLECIAFLIIFTSVAAGCAHSPPLNSKEMDIHPLLPMETSAPLMPFTTFSEAKTAYDNVKEGQTTLTELKDIGFNLEEISDADKWNEIHVQRYLQGLTDEGQNIIPFNKLSPGAQTCLNSHGNAWVFDLHPKETKGVVTSNVVLDFSKRFIGYGGTDLITGWRLWAFFCYDKNEVVLYKLVDYKPKIYEVKVSRDPVAMIRGILIGTGASIFALFR